MLDLFLSHLIYFTAVIDPIGTIPVFIAVTSGVDASMLKPVAIRAISVALGVLLFFVVVGELIFKATQVPLAAFQVAGGLVLFLFALSMIFGESKPETEVKLISQVHEKAVYPLAIPSIAGPGAMLAAVLLTENATQSIAQQAVTVAAMCCVLLVTLVLLLFAAPIHRWIGASGASIVSRVMGIVLSAVGVNNVLSGLSAYFKLS